MTTMETPQSANLREYCGWTGNTEDDFAAHRQHILTDRDMYERAKEWYT